MPATTADLTDADDTASRLRPRLDATAPSGPWPGTLPAPSPTVVLDAGGTGEPGVTASPPSSPTSTATRSPSADAVSSSASPATLTIGSAAAQEITGWAGPWPLDERWWDERRHRRLARFQVVTADGAAHLVVVERRQWRVLASYA